MKTVFSVVMSLFWVLSMNSYAVTPTQPSTPAPTTTIAHSINEFAFDLYTQLRTKDDNLFFSPYSLASALTMTYAGARGRTEQQMAKILHLDTTSHNIHATFAALEKYLSKKDDTYQLYIANALWGQQDTPFLGDFQALLKQSYGAELTPVDFITATESARSTINQWVASKTHDKIKELLKPGILTNLTRLVLTNAIYFKGNWEFPFDSRMTEERPFNLAKDQQIKVPTLYQKGQAFSYLDMDDMQLLELPYQLPKGKTTGMVSMIILLPKQVDGLSVLETKLSAKQLDNWLTQLDNRHNHEKMVEVYLPKFNIATAVELNKPLITLGMVDAFDSKQADFSGMSGQKDLTISAVVHNSFINITEQGTEAAAATAAVAGMRGMMPNAVVFRADHPFLFLIREDESGAILFLGRVVKPN